MKSATPFVALLRGVNVGGNNMVSMASLKTSFEKLGFDDVATYINSGNVLFKAREADARKLERRIEAMLSKQHQLGCKVIVRSLAEMAKLVKSLPPTWTGDSRWRYNVIFLHHSIDSENLLKDLGPKTEIEDVVYRPGTLLWSAQVSEITRTTMLKLSARKTFQPCSAATTSGCCGKH